MLLGCEDTFELKIKCCAWHLNHVIKLVFCCCLLQKKCQSFNLIAKTRWTPQTEHVTQQKWFKLKHRLRHHHHPPNPLSRKYIEQIQTLQLYEWRQFCHVDIFCGSSPCCSTDIRQNAQFYMQVMITSNTTASNKYVGHTFSDWKCVCTIDLQPCSNELSTDSQVNVVHSQRLNMISQGANPKRLKNPQVTQETQFVRGNTLCLLKCLTKHKKNPVCVCVFLCSHTPLCGVWISNSYAGT